ncbi:MAG: hypothetical protein J6032_07405 [Bacteroidales bacterium]|nr:hypothetical protein [Bacteroidales bacterium]
MLYAKSHLSSKEYQHFLVLFRLMDFDEKDNSFAWTELFYTRHEEKVHLVRESDKIEIQNCIFFEQIRQVAGLADFDCYYY